MLSEKKIGALMLREDLVSTEKWKQAIEEKRKDPQKRIVDILLNHSLVDENELLNFFQNHYQIPVVNLDESELTREIASKLPGSLCIKYNLVPIAYKVNGLDADSLVVAVSDPSNIVALDQIRFQSKMRIQPVLASYSRIRSVIEKFYGIDVARLSSDLQSSEKYGSLLKNKDSSIVVAQNLGSDFQEGDDSPIIQFVSVVLTDAIRKKASDVHIEPYENDLRVRFRIDGELIDSVRPPPHVKNAIIARIKVMANLRLDERRLPQDGRVRFKLPEGKIVDFRVSLLPTVHGEKVVIRILDKSNVALKLRELGLEEDDYQKFLKNISKPWGMCLVTGATGSGKTTTLYAGLSLLNKASVNITTIEDPVEYNFMGMNQVQVKDSIGLGFAEALRSILRQDPDIILLGEIRDSATAEIAMKSALTGHMVLTTLHTNDAASTIVRLKDLNVEPFLINSAVRVIASQKLLRKICTHCKVVDKTVRPEDLVRLGFPEKALNSFQVMKGKGCSHCRDSGIGGRLAVYEVLEINDEIREAIGKNASTAELRKIAIKNGMRELRVNTMRKIIRGEVSLEALSELEESDNKL